METAAAPMIRRTTRQAQVGGIAVGGDAPIVVQSMTNTDTADVAATVAQVQALAQAGSELVRVTVNTAEAAAAVATIRRRLDDADCHVPLIGDFQIYMKKHRLNPEVYDHPNLAMTAIILSLIVLGIIAIFMVVTLL
jgi:(E)-4-hydroxy-3-methylbut-2-enyl-diphosphate synthase